VALLRQEEEESDDEIVTEARPTSHSIVPAPLLQPSRAQARRACSDRRRKRKLRSRSPRPSESTFGQGRDTGNQTDPREWPIPRCTESSLARGKHPDSLLTMWDGRRSSASRLQHWNSFLLGLKSIVTSADIFDTQNSHDLEFDYYRILTSLDYSATDDQVLQKQLKDLDRWETELEWATKMNQKQTIILHPISRFQSLSQL
jgi:hypothetical protein